MKKDEIFDYRIGEENTNCQGVKMRIIEYTKSNDIKVLFLNGQNEIRKTRYEHFLSGRVRCYSNIIGKKSINKNGTECVAIKCVDNKHVQIQYNNGKTNIIKRTLFNTGCFPDYIETFDLLDKFPIADFDGYFVDKKGNIYNNKGRRLKKVLVCGYQRVSLPKDGKIKNVLVHRIVANTFIPNPNNLPQVNHKDGDRSNNSINNLEWVTASENQIHAVKFLGKNSKGEKNSQHVLNNNDVMKIIELSKIGKTYKEIAKIFGMSPTTIHGILHGKSWVHVTGINGKTLGR